MCVRLVSAFASINEILFQTVHIEKYTAKKFIKSGQDMCCQKLLY